MRSPVLDCRWLMAGLVGVVLMAACAPAAGPAAAPAAAPPAEPARPKTLVFGSGGEPRGLGQLFTGGRNVMAPIFTIMHDFLVRIDNQGKPVPSLAAELLSREKGTWVINPDGTMVTTWTLRTGVKWHDGTLFHPEDMVLGLKVSQHPEVPFASRRVANLIDRMEVPDGQTLVIHWKAVYPFADTLEMPDHYPLPRHILERLFQENPRDVQISPYWHREFVGLGPYRLVEWVPGSHMTLAAHPDFHLGEPRISKVIHRFIEDENTLAANMLSGEIDLIVPASTLPTELKLAVKRQWESDGRGQVIDNPVGRFRHMGIAFRNPVLHDLRIRQAFLFALDRESMAEVIVADRNRKIDSWIMPGMERYQRAGPFLQSYGYDPARAVRLLEEAGYPGGPTSVTTPAGERMRVEYRGSKQEGSLTCSNWRAVGVLCDEETEGGPLAQDPEWQATYPWFNGTAGPASMGFVWRRLHTSQIPTAATRWRGSNDGEIRVPEVDRLVDAYNVAPSRQEAEQIEFELAGLVSRLLAVYPLYSTVTSIYMRKGITGPRPMAAVGATGDLWETWNIHEWDRQ